LYCESEYVEFYKDVYLPSINLEKNTESDLQKHYLDSFIKIFKSKNIWVNDISIDFNNEISKEFIYNETYFKRININSYKDFLKLDADFIDLIFFPFSDKIHISDSLKVASIYFESSIIFSASLIDTLYTKEYEIDNEYGTENKLRSDYINYKFKINKFIKGSYLLSNIPETVSLKAPIGNEILTKKKLMKAKVKKEYKNKLYPEFNIGELVIFTKKYTSSLTDIEEFQKGKLKDYFDDLSNDFIPFGWIYELNFASDKKERTTSVIEYFDKLEAINDSPNFYKRSYK